MKTNRIDPDDAPDLFARVALRPTAHEYFQALGTPGAEGETFCGCLVTALALDHPEAAAAVSVPLGCASEYERPNVRGIALQWSVERAYGFSSEYVEGLIDGWDGSGNGSNDSVFRAGYKDGRAAQRAMIRSHQGEDS